MRMVAQGGAFYRKPLVDGTDDPEALRRPRIVEGVDLTQARFTAEAAEVFGVSRTIYCEWVKRLRGRREGAGSGKQPASDAPRPAVAGGGRPAHARAAARDAVGGERADRSGARRALTRAIEDGCRALGLPLLVQPPRSPLRRCQPRLEKKAARCFAPWH